MPMPFNPPSGKALTRLYPLESVKPGVRPVSWRALLICFCAPCAMGWANERVPTLNPVPQDWVDRARKAVEKGAPIGDLVREFARTHHDPEAFPAKSSDWTEPYLSLVPVDLDGDGIQEQVLFISGAYKDQTRLYVLRRLNDRWVVAYTHQAWAHNEPPTYEVLDCGEGKHAFHFVHLEGYGTGSWQYTSLFLRAVGGNVVCGLEIVDEHNLALPGYDLIGNAHSSKITVRGDDLSVVFTYEFNGGFSLLEKLKIGTNDSKDEDVLVKGTAQVTYRWEPGAKKYRLIHAPLTEDQLRCFTRLYDERLFCKAFKNELRSLAERGTPSQRVLARYFLRMHRKGHKIGTDRPPGGTPGPPTHYPSFW